MAASFLALLAAYPAFAADTDKHTTSAEIKADARVAADKAEAKLDQAGDVISEKAKKAGTVIDEKTEQAGAVVREKYADMKAYFTDEKDVATMSSVNFSGKLTERELMGRTVVDAKGVEIGKIDDLLVDADGEVEQVIITNNGTLGVDGKLVSIDSDVLDGAKVGGDAKLTLKNDDAKEAKGFSADQADAGASSNLFSVDKIIGSKIVDANGKAVAKVEALVFDGDEADYAIVAFDQILGVGGERAALDFEALDLSNMGGKYTFKLNEQQSAQFKQEKDSAKTAN